MNFILHAASRSEHHDRNNDHDTEQKNVKTVLIKTALILVYHLEDFVMFTVATFCSQTMNNSLPGIMFIKRGNEQNGFLCYLFFTSCLEQTHHWSITDQFSSTHRIFVSVCFVKKIHKHIKNWWRYNVYKLKAAGNMYFIRNLILKLMESQFRKYFNFYIISLITKERI